jgi:hypothetical protein
MYAYMCTIMYTLRRFVFKLRKQFVVHYLYSAVPPHGPTPPHLSVVWDLDLGSCVKAAGKMQDIFGGTAG